jgi:hypothetical protein
LSKKDGTKYFQDKADTDKKRYLKEQKDFYDEVERIHRDAKVDKEDSAQEVQIPNFKNVIPEHDDHDRRNALLRASQPDYQLKVKIAPPHSEVKTFQSLEPASTNAPQSAGLKTR